LDTIFYIQEKQKEVFRKLFTEKNIYIGKLYLKNFFFIWIGLILFFITIDYVQAGRSVIGSNSKILYIYYKSLSASAILFPISLIFSSIVTFGKLIRDNTLVAFYSMGYSNRDIVIVPFFMSIFLIFIYIFANFTSYAVAEDRAKAVKHGESFDKSSEALFFKHDVMSKNGKTKSYYIYFSHLYPFRKTAKDIRMFSIEDEKISEVIRAKSGYYNENRWTLLPAKFLYNNIDLGLNQKAIEIREYPKASLLKGFKPKILDKIYENNPNFRFGEIFEAMRIMNMKGFSTVKIKATFYYMLVFPFIAPFTILIVFHFTPVSSRFRSLNLYIFLGILSTLLFWGFMFAISMLAKTGTVPSEIVIVFPVFLLSLTSLYFIRKGGD
jgi:lipopolysaccharide export system permease protein